MTWRSTCVVSLAALAAVFSFAFAASVFDIEYPIPELGNCADRLECKTYCNSPDNAEACFEFAKKYGLADSRTEEKINQVRKLAEDPGPGGCDSRESCEEYCKDPNHSEECIDDAVRRGFMSKEEAERSRKFAAGGPGGCRGDECRTYCDDVAHENECFEFAAENGFIDKQEVERIRDLKKKFDKQEGPGGCKNERDCRMYCDNPDHTEECVDFAEKNGFMTSEEAKRIKKIGLAGGPGGCKGAEACRTYCEDPEHQQECIDFAEREGLMSKDEVAQARKFVGKTGPGGCKGERECRAFCDNPDNSETCLAHAEQEGLMPKEEIDRARKFLNASKDGGPGGCKGAQCRDYCENPEHRDECFDFAKKQGLIRPEEEQQFDIGRKLDQKMRESGGPGGCKTENECRAYCSNPSQVEECVAFASTHAGVSQEDAVELLRQFAEHRFGPPPPPGGPQRGSMPMGPPGGFRQFEEGSLRRFEEFRQLEEKFRGGDEFPERPPFEGEEDRGDKSMSRPYMATGPGGCASPDECIKYCIEHKDECFNFGPTGRPQTLPSEGGFPPGRNFEAPRLRGDLFNNPRSDNQDFDARSGQQQMDFRREDEGNRPNGGIAPPNDMRQFRDEFQRQYQERFWQETERQMQQMPIDPRASELPVERMIPQRPMVPLDPERERMMVPLIPEGWTFPEQPTQPQFAPPPGEFQPPPEGHFEGPTQTPMLEPVPALEPAPDPTRETSYLFPPLQLAGVLFSTFFGY